MKDEKLGKKYGDISEWDTSKITNIQAYTIHRLLQFESEIGQFRYNERNPLNFVKPITVNIYFK